jgi:hypothetical protein
MHEESSGKHHASRHPVPAALGFAQQYGVPIPIVVCDNRGYMSQTWNVHKYLAGGAAVRSGQFFGDVLTPTPDYVRLAEAYGGTEERVENAAALEPAIDRALAALAVGRSALFDVVLTGVPEGEVPGLTGCASLRIVSSSLELFNRQGVQHRVQPPHDLGQLGVRLGRFLDLPLTS